MATMAACASEQWWSLAARVEIVNGTRQHTAYMNFSHHFRRTCAAHRHFASLFCALPHEPA